MTFANFIIIQYALLIERVPVLESLFDSLWIFASVFVAIYIPLAIGIGYWHRKSQLKIEQEPIFNESVMNARMWLFMFELIEGKVSDEEKTQMRNMLKGITKKLQIEKPEANIILDKESKPTTK